MKRRLKARMANNIVVIVLFLFAASAAFSTKMLGAWWYRLDAVVIGDGPVFNDLPVTFTRSIRPFQGSYVVSIWPVARTSPACQGVGSVNYRTPARKTDTRDMLWWMGEQRPECKTQVVPGLYTAETCVTVEMTDWWNYWLPDPVICRESNVFEITAPSAS